MSIQSYFINRMTDLCVLDYRSSAQVLLNRPLTLKEWSQLLELCNLGLNSADHVFGTLGPLAREKGFLTELLADLDSWFSHNAGTAAFVRLSSLSPKDYAWFYRQGEWPTIKECGEALRVESANQIIEVLTHSFRVYEHMQDNPTRPEAIVLLPWLELQHCTEVRVFIRDDRIRWISQQHTARYNFYTDEERYWFHDDKRRTLYIDQVIGFCRTKMNPKYGPTYCIDVAMTVDSQIVLIEMNRWDSELDQLLFSKLWDDADVNDGLVLVRYKDKWRRNRLHVISMKTLRPLSTPCTR